MPSNAITKAGESASATATLVSAGKSFSNLASSYGGSGGRSAPGRARFVPIEGDEAILDHAEDEAASVDSLASGA